jgi:hypothetical protein
LTLSGVGAIGTGGCGVVGRAHLPVRSRVCRGRFRRHALDTRCFNVIVIIDIIISIIIIIIGVIVVACVRVSVLCLCARPARDSLCRLFVARFCADACRVGGGGRVIDDDSDWWH